MSDHTPTHSSPPNGELFPAPTLSLRVGVTANRWRNKGEPEGFRLNPERRESIERTVRHVLEQIQRNVDRVHESDVKREFYSEHAPMISLISPLAEGGDRIVATAARSLKKPWELDIISSEDISAKIDRDPHIPLAPLWKAARSRMILDGDRDNEESLVEVNRRLLWNCDLLVAVWDKQGARGEAGTANVIDLASELGLPVIHIEAEPHHAQDKLHAYHVLEPGDVPGSNTKSSSSIERVIERLLGPPEDTRTEIHEKKRVKVGRYLEIFRGEKVSSAFVRNVTGIVWGGMMRMLTARDERARPPSWRIKPSPEVGYPPPWENGASSGTSVLRQFVSPSYRRADYFATAYAVRHRGSTVWLVLLAPIAVLLAWWGTPFAYEVAGRSESVHESSLSIFMVLFELTVLLVIIVVYRRARNRYFHERWLDYRLLAERFRHLGFLWLMGRGSLVQRVPVQRSPEDPHTAWVNWWYRATARQLPVPNVVFNGAYLQWYAEFLRANVVKDQKQYMDTTYHTAEVAEHRLRTIAWWPFWAALGGASAHLLIAQFHWHVPNVVDGLITFCAFALPGFGAALHAFASNLGLPEQALRSASTMRALDVILEGLRIVDINKPLASVALGNLAQQTASALGDDLVGWRVDYLVRPTPQPG